MRLVFVHGINNEGSSSASIANDWIRIIERAVGRPGVLGPAEVVAPFYGDRLAAFTHAAGQTVADAVAQGAGIVPDEDAEFVKAMVDEIATSLEIDPEDIQRESDEAAVALGPGRVITLPTLRLIERYWPGGGDFALKFIKQANAYFNCPGAKKAIDALVAPDLARPGPQVVIAHSLGSVVAFDLLRRNPGETRLFMTLGSPLSLETVRSKLGPPLAVPQGVGHWMNAIDTSDFVGLGKGLVPPSFASGVENLTDIRNGWNAHGIKGYLSDQRVAAAVIAALT